MAEQAALRRATARKAHRARQPLIALGEAATAGARQQHVGARIDDDAPARLEGR